MENSLVKAVMDQYGLPEKMVRRLLLPDLGEEFIVRGLVYKVVYLNEGKCGFSAVPIRTAIPEKAKKNLKRLGIIQKLRKVFGR